MKIVSWNVNGLRACAKKGFLQWLETCDAHVVGVQEIRARAEQLPTEIRDPDGWHTHFQSAEKPGYSGVGLFARSASTELTTSIGEERFDSEGRVQLARFGNLRIANVYFPNGSGKDRDNGRVPFKLAFYRRLFDLLEPERRAGAPILVMGDFNTAHREIDLARPKSNKETSGFLPEEREELDRWLREGWVDTFRHFNAAPDHYTWWSNRFGARGNNVGWRIDYVLASPGAMLHIRDAFIWPDVMGSDHCPLGVEMDAQALRN